MAKYNYIVKTKKGEVREGKLEAPSSEVVKEVLEKKDYLVVEISKEEKAFAFSLPFIGGISHRDKAVFIRQLATMLDAGISMSDALNIIVSQSNKRHLREVTEDVRQRVEGGTSLSKAMAKHPSVFDRVFIAVVSSGEATGKLPQTLIQLAEELELEEEFTSKFKAAMIYPVFIMVALIVVMGIMMVFVVPQLKDMFESSEMALPWTTRILLAVSGFVASYWWALILLVIAAVVVLRFYLKTEAGQYFWSRLQRRIPVFRALIEGAAMVRFCRTISLLLGTGIPILRAIRLSGQSQDNLIYRDALDQSAKEVERGVPFSVPLEKSGVFPVVVPQMIRVGEQSGQVPEILEKLSRFYQQETETRMQAISSMIEPVIIVILGLGVGFVVFSIIVPIYQISLGVL